MLEKHVKEIEQFVPSIVQKNKSAVMPDRKQFTRLLSAATAFRKVPGISERVDADTDYVVDRDTLKTVRDFLKKMYRIDSRESLIEYQRIQFRGSVQYEQFMTFWKEAPLFDLNELNPEGKKAFDKTISLAEPFYPLLQEKGFYAWDISEYIGICRIAMGCGIINEDEFDEITDRFVRKAQVFYHSFKDYALSYICGALFFSASSFDDQEGLDLFFGIQKSILEHLFGDDGEWSTFKWYVPREREWVQIYPGEPGCFVTKAALDQGIEYMYRDNAVPDRPDSGWRFFHGDETDEYANDPANIQIVSLNTVCNLCPSVLAFLEAPADSAYAWNGKDWIKET